MNLNGTYIKIDILFFVARRSPNRRSSVSFAEQHTPWMSGRRMRGDARRSSSKGRSWVYTLDEREK
jgi:hypothetical protein